MVIPRRHKYCVIRDMIRSYFILNAVLYLLFSIWCLIKPGDTAKNLGYDFLNNSGKAEYAAVYIGMELGLCVFFSLCAYDSSLQKAGLIFATCFYLGLMIARTFAVVSMGNMSKATYIIGGLEYLLGLTGILLLWMELRQ
jgi:hypothetical protein